MLDKKIENFGKELDEILNQGKCDEGKEVIKKFINQVGDTLNELDMYVIRLCAHLFVHNKEIPTNGEEALKAVHALRSSHGATKEKIIYQDLRKVVSFLSESEGPNQLKGYFMEIALKALMWKCITECEGSLYITTFTFPEDTVDYKTTINTYLQEEDVNSAGVFVFNKDQENRVMICGWKGDQNLPCFEH